MQTQSPNPSQSVSDAEQPTSEAMQPSADVMRPTSARALNPTARNLFAGAAMLIGIGSAGPWATILGSVSVSGTATSGGKVSLGCAAIVLVLALKSGPRWAAGVSVLIAGAIGVIGLADVNHLVAGTHGLAQVGWGLYVVVVGAGLGVVALFDPAREPNVVADEAHAAVRGGFTATLAMIFEARQPAQADLPPEPTRAEIAVGRAFAVAGGVAVLGSIIAVHVFGA